MMKKDLTKSEKISVLILLMLVSSAICYAYYISSSVEARDLSCNPGIELGEGAYFEDTIRAPYSHLYITFHEVQIDPNQSEVVYIEGYENVKEFYSTRVKNDTLYIGPKTECDPRPVETDGLSAVKIIVGVKDIGSITIDKKGKLLTPIKAYGADKNGRPVYSETQLKRHLFVFNELAINLKGSGSFNLLTKGNKLNLNYENYSSGYPNLYGNINEINIDYNSGFSNLINLAATNTFADVVRINNDKIKDENLHGAVNVYVNNMLSANLYGNMDVFYKGKATVAKEEKGLGRVVNVNGVIE